MGSSKQKLRKRIAKDGVDFQAQHTLSDEDMKLVQNDRVFAMA